MNNEDNIIAAKKAIVGDWLGRPGVTGMDVGFKYVGGKRTADVAIRLFVRKKLAEVAPEERFPSLVGRHKTDVIECEFKPINLPDTKYYNPTVGGVQLFSPNTPFVTFGTVGTAGMFVTDNVTGQLMILGTFHGSIAPGTPIFQPWNTSQPDGTNGQIGYLIRGGHYSTPPVDADLFLFGAPRDTNFIIEQLGCVKGVTTVNTLDFGGNVFIPPIAVTKRGVTTGVTQGSLDGVNYTSSPYPADYQGKVITYDNLLTFAGDPATNAPLGQQGDSGSVILDSNNNAVALLTLAVPGATNSPGPSTAGPAFPDILATLNVTPCFCGMILPRKITLTSSEAKGTAPANWPGEPIVAWGQSVSGEELVKLPNGRESIRKWTITNVYQNLIFNATVLGFNKPVFRWWINGKQVNDFNADTVANVTVAAAVRTDTQLAPAHPATLEQVTLSIEALHEAVYNLTGTHSFPLIINPTTVQGHIPITVRVDVCESSLASLNPVPPADISWAVASATLDTQVLTL